MKKEKSELQLVIDEKEKEAASLNRQVAEANRLRNESEDLLSQVQEPKCLPDKARAVATSGQCNCKITGTKVKLKTAKEKSSLGHHGAFLKQSIKVMSNVFENFSKDGWEDVNESSNSEIPNPESLETVIMKTVQNIDPLPDRSKQQEKKSCNTVCLEGQNEQYNKKMLTSNLAKWQQEKEDLQGKLKLREHLSQTAGKTKATPAPSKNIDLEMKQLQCKLKNSNNEITKQSTTIKSLKNEVQEKEERIRELQAKISQLERDVTVKRHLIEDLKSHLKASQENEKTSNETLESLEKKVKALAEDCSGKKTSIDSLKQRLNVATKEKSQYEQMYHKAKDELGKKDLKLTKLESKMIETECAMTELETAASDQLHSLAKQSAEALETLQKKLLLTSEKVEEFKTFVKTLSRELQHSIQELRTKIRKAKKMGKMKACKNCLSQESVQLAASILNVSTTDLEEILDVEDEEVSYFKDISKKELDEKMLYISILGEKDFQETAKAKMEFEKDKEWLQRIQKLMEAQETGSTLSGVVEKQVDLEAYRVISQWTVGQESVKDEGWKHMVTAHTRRKVPPPQNLTGGTGVFYSWYDAPALEGQTAGVGYNVPQLKCFYINAHSTRNKQEELKALAQSQRFDIIGISEPWWDEICDWSWVVLSDVFTSSLGGMGKYRNIIGLLQDEDDHLTDRDRHKAEVFNAFFASVFNMDDGPGGLSALSWRTTTAPMISSQLTLKLCVIYCSSWIPRNLWGLMEFSQNPQRPADVITNLNNF
ncbi:hypothetical protein BTVI_46018 [Pitangus sulphuratus]|nr:hypothetical protein BTVI_46018 [Pitangus sulphuratus]